MEDESDKILAAHFAGGIEIDEDEETATLRLTEPFAVASGHKTHVRQVTTSSIVELIGRVLNFAWSGVTC